MNRTGIEYLDYTWNPIAMRCTPVSEGCANCWHQRMADRLAGNQSLAFDVRRAYAGEGPPVLVEERLMNPIRREKPARIGVQFMGDLFNENVPTSFLHRIWAIMADHRVRKHAFQILTKRPERMVHFVCSWTEDVRYVNSLNNDWALPNVWLGVSVENQRTANERREYLRQTPAAIKYVSYEPALGPVDWTGWEFVDQIISGGESGPKARPSHPDWHRLTRDFCQQHNIAYFFKQHGAWTAEALKILACKEGKDKFAKVKRNANDEKGVWMARVGKKEAGRLLDGKEWNEFPSYNKLVIENHSPINVHLG